MRNKLRCSRGQVLTESLLGLPILFAFVLAVMAGACALMVRHWVDSHSEKFLICTQGLESISSCRQKFKNQHHLFPWSQVEIVHTENRPWAINALVKVEMFQATPLAMSYRKLYSIRKPIEANLKEDSL